MPGALLIGMLASTAVGLGMGLVHYQGLVAAPPSIAPTFFQLDLAGAVSAPMLPVILIFFFLALFDSVGTLVGVASHAGLLRDGTLPRARQALLADAVGTVAGAALGTSTVTAYIESATGVAAGGRTGLANVVTAALFLLSLFFHPLVKMIGGGYPVGGNAVLYPVVAPALVLVGTFMIAGVSRDRVGRPHRGDPGVPDDDPDAADGEHHRGDRVRVHRLRGLEDRQRPSPRGASAGLCVRGAVRRPLRFPLAASHALMLAATGCFQTLMGASTAGELLQEGQEVRRNSNMFSS